MLDYRHQTKIFSGVINSSVLKVTAENGTDLNNLIVAPTGDLPQGVHLDCGSSISFVQGGRSVTLNLTLWADNTAEDASPLEMTVSSDESGSTPWATVLVDALYSESEPALYFTPDHIKTGVALALTDPKKRFNLRRQSIPEVGFHPRQ